MNICNPGCTDNALKATHLPNLNEFQLTYFSRFDWAAAGGWGSMSFRTWLWTQCSWNMVGFSSHPTTKNWARSFLTALFPYSCINGDLLFKRSKEALRNSDPLRAHTVVIKVFPSDTTGRQSSISEQRFAYHDASTCISLAQLRWDKQASLPDY